MQIKLTTQHNVTFSVEYFADTEVGMITDSFGSGEKDTLESAIELLQIARNTDQYKDWIIVCHVKTTSYLQK